MRQTACFLFGVAFVTTSLSGQSQPPAVKTTTAGVLIDVTVLDRKGQPVLDLTPADFELSEDGKRQQIVSVTLVRGRVPGAVDAPAVAAPIAPETAAGATTAAPEPESARPPDMPTVTAILFDRLSAESRLLARQAAFAYLSTLSPANEYAGVFLADLSLRVFHPFTNDIESLRRAVDRVVVTAPANTADAEHATSKRLGGLDPNQPVTASAESDSGWVSVEERERRLSQMDLVEAMFAKMELRMAQGYRQMLAEYGGQASIAGLRAAVDALATLRGRKSILYFTESLSVTAQLKAKFEELIGQANRANVTIYPVDAAGLRVHSEEARVNRNVALAGAQGLGDAQREDGAWTKELERQEQILSSRPTAVLGRLAKNTGGFVIENTNDLGAGVARMQQERTTYYLLGYQPTNATMDGKFRRVKVKVKRPKVSARARPGYLAIPTPAR